MKNSQKIKNTLQPTPWMRELITLKHTEHWTNVEIEGL